MDIVRCGDGEDLIEKMMEKLIEKIVRVMRVWEGNKSEIEIDEM